MSSYSRQMSYTVNEEIYSHFVVLFSGAAAQNLSCYQCIRDTETECNESDLRPCKSVADRCVIHVKKDRTYMFFFVY